MLGSNLISREFVHWLDGYLEAFEGKGLDKEQTKKVSDRLNQVFHHEIDPEQDVGRDAKELRKIHDGEALPDHDPEPFDRTIRDMC